MTGFRKDSRETIRELNHQHLRAYLASGVTTVLDAGIDPLADLRALRIIQWTARDGVARTPAEWMAAR